MVAHFREPFFLRCRRGVLLRAIVMSLALCVIGSVAGVLGAVLVWLLNTTVGWNAVGGNYLLLTGGAAAVSLATVAGVPYSRWLGYSALGIWARVTWIVLTVLVLVSYQPTLAGQRVFGPLLQRLTSMAGNEFIGESALTLVFLWLGWGTAYFRCSWTWLVNFCVSALSVPLWIASVAVVAQVLDFGIRSFPPPVVEILNYLGVPILNAQFFSALTVSWGMAFWWESPSEAPPAKQNPLPCEIEPLA